MPLTLRAEKLRLLLPTAIRNSVEAGHFLADLERIISHTSTRPKRSSADERRSALQDIEGAAHRMRNRLRALEFGSEAYDELEPPFDYLLKKARAGHPVVDLPEDTPELPDMLERLISDLSALRAACEYAAKAIPVDRNAPDKGRERLLVSQVANAYLMAFGKPPPKRSWFADDLIAYIGSELGLDIGQRIVGEIVGPMK